jgi:hypothetical protein
VFSPKLKVLFLYLFFSQGQSVPKTASQKKPQSGKNWFKLATKKIHKICFNRAENSSKIPFGLV